MAIGYYLVKRATDTSNINDVTNLVTVYCAFKQPEGSSFNLSTEEKRTDLLESNRNSKGKCLMVDNKIVDKIYFFFLFRFLVFKGRGVMTEGLPRFANLINSLGKCATISGDYSSNAQQIIQWDCNQIEKGMLWSWNGTSLRSGNRHLCNGHGKCAGSRANSPNSNADVIQWKHVGEEGQRYHFVDSLSRLGFYLIKNDHGKCLSVHEDKKINGASIRVNNCNSSEEGQNWKWGNI